MTFELLLAYVCGLLTSPVLIVVVMAVYRARKRKELLESYYESAYR